MHLGGLPAGGGGGKIKEVMQLFSNGRVWNIFAKFSLFSRNNDSMLESMIDKNVFEEPKTPMRQEKFY